MKRVLVCFAFICLVFPGFTAYGAQEERPALIVISKIKKGVSADTTKITGNLYFENTSLVSPEIAGKAEAVFFEEGQIVKKGQKLLKTDTQLLEKELSIQRSQLAQIDIRLEKTKKDLGRYEELYKNDAASESSYDDLKFGYAGLIEEKSALHKNIDMTVIKLEKSVVSSPFKGIIIQKSVENGNWVQPGASIARIGSLDSVSVKVPVSEKFIKFSKKGDHLNIKLTAVDKNLKGKVIGFMPYADPKTRTLFLKLAVDYPGPFAENMSALVDVPSSPKKDVFIVIRDALISGEGGKIIYTVENGRAKSLKVQVAGYDGEFVHIKSNEVKEGMSVVIEGNQRLHPGQAVTVAGEK